MTAKPRKPLLVNLTLAGAALVLLYIVSVGPACWVTSKVNPPYPGIIETHRPIMRVYFPLGRIALYMESAPGDFLRWWMRLGVKDGESVEIPTTFSGDRSVELGP